MELDTLLQEVKPYLRKPEQVMKLARLGSFHQSRLSFMRILLRRLKSTNWEFSCQQFSINEKAEGVAVYNIKGKEHTYSLICFAHDLPPEMRTDRVIATQWDSTFALFDGIPTQESIEQLKLNVPKQEGGRYNDKVLVLSRANRSVRLFDYIVECLSQNQQPELSKITKVGYIMRTTAVYGNGKFGICDRSKITNRAEFKAPFQVELLCVWLIRQYAVDLIEHIAKFRSPDTSCSLAENIKSNLGVGNSTGLGMAPFLIRHPALIHQWIFSKEVALAKIRSIKNASLKQWQIFLDCFDKSIKDVHYWQTDSDRQNKSVEVLKTDLTTFRRLIANNTINATQNYPWNNLYQKAEELLNLEAQELIASLLLEPYPELVDSLADNMAVNEDEHFYIDASQTIEKLKKTIDKQYQWTVGTNYENKDESARFWYYSQEKMEPRLGERYLESGEELEEPLCYPRDICRIQKTLESYPKDNKISDFITDYPELRHAIRRIQIIEKFPYGEIQDNLISKDLVPVDLLRCKLSFFGAKHFDPRSDRWLRINMFKHAPYPKNLSQSTDYWCYPSTTQ